MFALLALISFILALFNVHIGSINLVTLGFVFLSAHLLLGGIVWSPSNWKRSPNT